MSATFFGQYLLQKGIVSRENLLRAVEVQSTKHLRLGELALAAGLLTPAQIADLTREQRTVDKKIGELAVSHGLLTLPQVKDLLAKQRAEQQMLGEALIKIGAISELVLRNKINAFELSQQNPVRQGLAPKVPNGAEFSELSAMTGSLLQRCSCVLSKPGVAVIGPLTFDRSFLQIQVSLVGLLRGRYVLRMPKDLAMQISVGMGNSARTDQELGDAACEFASVVAGNFCSKVASKNQTQSMTPPVANFDVDGQLFKAGAQYVMQPRFTAFGELQVLFLFS